MINKYVMFTLSFLALICASATAGDLKDYWRNNPLTTKNSNEWKKKPYVSSTSDSWRNSSLNARKFESKLGWEKIKSQKSPTYWRNSALLTKPVALKKLEKPVG
jgi:hypothetical protein